MNLGGLTHVEYAPTTWVNRNLYDPIISVEGNWQKAIEFETGNWLSLPLLTDRRNWNERGIRTEQGMHYEQTVGGTIPALRPEASIEIAEMEEYRFLLRLLDRNGQYWILGTLDNPFDFIVEAASGDARNGLNNYSVQFRCVTRRRAYGYVPYVPPE